MKILHISQRYYPAIGGAENYIRRVSEFFAEDKRNIVDVWTSDAWDIDSLWDASKKRFPVYSEEINGVKIKRFKIWPNNKLLEKAIRVTLLHMPGRFFKYISSTPSVFSLLFKSFFGSVGSYDVIHVSAAPYYILFFAGARIAKRTGAKLILSPFVHLGNSIDDPIRKKYLNPAFAPLYMAADYITFQTEAEKQGIVDMCIASGKVLADDKFVKLGMGIDPNELSGGNGKRFRKKYSIREPIVFYVGSRSAGKGTINLVKTMELFWANGGKARLVLAGSDTKDFTEFWPSVNEQVRANTLVLNSITDDEKKDLFDAGDLFSMVSKSDSFGIVYLEAWFYKKPVIACKNEVMEDIIDDGKDGYLVEFDDIEKQASTIKELLSRKEECVKMGDYGHKKVLANYTWEKKLAILKDLYDRRRI